MKRPQTMLDSEKMATMKSKFIEDTNPERCPFMDLPSELRLAIYGFALEESPIITIGSSKIIGSHPDIVHRLYGDGRKPHPGLPGDRVPTIDPLYNPSLLSIADRAVISLTPRTALQPEQPSSAPHATHGNLMLVNKQVKGELESHFKIPNNRRTDLFVSYPDGLHVLRTMAPHLTKQARSIHIAGSYDSESYHELREACPKSKSHRSIDQRYHDNFTPNSAGQLSNLVASLFGLEAWKKNAANPGAGIQKFEIRTFYPGRDCYSTVWTDDSSPIRVALQNIFVADIRLEVWRGDCGTVVYLSAQPWQDQSKKTRSIATAFRRFGEGRPDEPKPGALVVDPEWPQWNVENR